MSVMSDLDVIRQERKLRETKVKRMVRTCGAWATARYLRNRGYTPEQAITLMYR